MVKQLSPWCGPQDSNLPCYDFKSFVSCLWTTPTYNQISLSNLHYELYHILLRLSSIFYFLQFRIHCKPHIPPLLACLHHHSSVSFQIECDFDTGSGGHLLSDPAGARCQNRTALRVPKTRVLPLHFILHINGAPCRNRTHFRCLQNNCSNH